MAGCATFSRNAALELGRVSLGDKDVTHGSNEDRGRGPSHGFNHLGYWRKTQNENQSSTVSVISNVFTVYT